MSYRIFGSLFFAASLHAGTLSISLTDLNFSSQGNYTFRLDERELAQVRHPLSSSEKGDYGRLEIKTRFPKGARPPFQISFYTSDDHERTPRAFVKAIPAGGGTVTSLIDEREGHRFKKCWINGKEVWRRDTLEADQPQPTIITLPDTIKPGEMFELALGIEDVVASSERLPGDRLEIARGSHGSFNIDFTRYETRSYWGDIAILWSGSKSPKAQWPPKIKAKPIALRAPMQPGLQELSIEKGELLEGKWSWPIEIGIPLAAGLMKHASATASASDETSFPSDFQAAHQWLDGSLMWGTLRFTLTPAILKAGQMVRLDLASSPSQSGSKPASPVTTGEKGHDKWLQSSGIALDIDKSGTWRFSDAKAQRVLERLQIVAGFEGRPGELKFSKAEWKSRSSWKAEILVESELFSEGVRQGRIQLTACAFADVPYVKLTLTLLPEGKKLQRLTRFGVRAKAAGALKVFPNGFSVSGKNHSIVGALRDAAHLGPNSITGVGDDLNVMLFRGDAKTSDLVMHEGEALGGELWFAIQEAPATVEDVAQFSALVDNPPGLNTSRLLRKSQVWGPLPKIDPASPVYEKLIKASFRPHFSAPLQGIRKYGDYNRRGILGSFYWNQIHTMYTLYAMTGEREWYDWADRSARRFRDSYVNRVGSGGRPAGGVKSRSSYEGDASYNGKYQMVHGLFDYGWMTGDSDAIALAKGTAEFLATDKQMQNQIHSRSSRENGWPLLFLVRAYQDTHDDRFLRAAKQIIPTVLKHVDARRGAYRQIHGNQSYPGIVPFMNGILLTALREYYQLTGDSRASDLIFQISWAIYAEMSDPARVEEFGGIAYDYTPNPYRRDPNVYKPIVAMNVPIVAGQAYAAALSGDQRLAKIAESGFDAFLNHPMNVNTPASAFDIAAAVFWLQYMEGEGR